MATLPVGFAPRSAEQAERRFYLIMAVIMAVLTFAGFALNVAMGRSSFAVPLLVHVHAGVFLTWLALYIAQNWFIAAGNTVLHKRLGLFSAGWVGVMVIVGITMSLSTLRRTGGPFFFAQNQFLFSNIAHLVTFAAVVIVAVRIKRHTGWHRRLMFTSMALLTSPGIGRLLPLPLLIPNAWYVGLAATLVFPIAGMISDKRHHGRVHPAWFWGLGAFAAMQIVADLVAYSAWGVGFTESWLAGHPGAERPMEAFLPPGFSM